MPISDYTINNLLLHLKALDALGLWKSPGWDEVAKLLGWDKSYDATIGDIDTMLLAKISEELGIEFDSEGEDKDWLMKAARVLRMKKQRPRFDEVINAFYWRQHSRRSRVQITLENGESIEIPEDIWLILPHDPYEGVGAWLITSNDNLSGVRPIDLIKSGELAPVRAELERLLDKREEREKEYYEKERAALERKRRNPLYRLLEAYRWRGIMKTVRKIDDRLKD